MNGACGECSRAVERAMRIVLLRLVPQHEHRLAFDVDAGVVVVVVILGRDAIADEDQGQVELGRAADGQRIEILAELEFAFRRPACRLRAGGDETQLVFVPQLGADA